MSNKKFLDIVCPSANCAPLIAFYHAHNSDTDPCTSSHVGSKSRVLFVMGNEEQFGPNEKTPFVVTAEKADYFYNNVCLFTADFNNADLWMSTFKFVDKMIISDALSVTELTFNSTYHFAAFILIAAKIKYLFDTKKVSEDQDAVNYYKDDLMFLELVDDLSACYKKGGDDDFLNAVSLKHRMFTEKNILWQAIRRNLFMFTSFVKFHDGNGKWAEFFNTFENMIQTMLADPEVERINEFRFLCINSDDKFGTSFSHDDVMSLTETLRDTAAFHEMIRCNATDSAFFNIIEYNHKQNKKKNAQF